MSFAWILLIASGVLEAVWATALDASQGFKKLWPSVLFVVTLAASLAGLSLALLEIPVGTAYAVWVGIGAVLTTGWAILTKKDHATLTRVLLMVGLISCVVGLKAVS